MELNDLVGLHKLSGVDFCTAVLDEDSGEWAQVVNFVLDGKTYSAIEDQNDGYRSCMDEIKVSDFRVTNKFKAVRVLCMMRYSEYSSDMTILDFVDVVNGKVVLSVGTDRSDGYYPKFVTDWRPENLHVNSQQAAERRRDLSGHI